MYHAFPANCALPNFQLPDPKLRLCSLYVVFVQRDGSVPPSVGSCLINNVEHFVLYAVYLFPILCTLFLVFSTLSVSTSGGRVWPVFHSILTMIAQELLSSFLSQDQHVNVLRVPRFHEGHHFGPLCSSRAG